MEKLIEVIENSDYIETGAPQNAAKARIYGKGMVEAGFADLPEEYIKFCSHFNGVWTDGTQVYAIDPEEGFLEDVLAKNDDWIYATSQQQLVLGENDFDFLVYDAEEEVYFMLDKDYGKLGRRFEELEQAVAVLLGL